MTQIPVVILKPGKEKPLLRGHPWIFSGAIASTKGDPRPGDLLLVKTESGEIMGLAGYSPLSQIRCRMWEFGDEFPSPIEDYFTNLLQGRFRQAIENRHTDPSLIASDSCRLIHAESDRVPGLIVDKYADVLVVQFLSYGAERWRDLIIKILNEECSPIAIFERSDAEVRKLEGLPEATGLLSGRIPKKGIIIEENGMKIHVGVETGHKTGFYLDQRDNRKLLRDYSAGKDVLDCFCYSGGFTLNALLGGAKTVVAVDQSEEALDLLERNLALNDFSEEAVERINDDVFQRLRKFRDQRKSFDLIILDPPKFAHNRSQAQKAARGYKDINLLATKLLNEGGVLFTFSCSGGVDPKLFQQIVAGAASDASVDLQIIRKMGQGSDHPILLNFPEAEYLKGLVCRRR